MDHVLQEQDVMSHLLREAGLMGHLVQEGDPSGSDITSMVQEKQVMAELCTLG